MLLQVKEWLDTNYCQVQDWQTFLHVSITHQISFIVRGTKYCGRKRLAMIIWKWKGSFQVHDFGWQKYHKVHVSSLWCPHAPKISTRHTKKNYVPKFTILLALKLPSCELVAFINMNMYIFTKGSDFRTFISKFMEFANIRHFCNLQQILISCNLTRWSIWQSVS